ncbi:MAG: hypothetical protein QNJ51_22095 [Calothrix sp. MO_167.B12]|nr:hypothetical protein [Calothrix sp. MO_167.B12]
MPQNILVYGAITVYSLMTVCFFKEWLFFLREDEESTGKQPVLQMLILVMASLLWPVIVPFAYLELLNFHKKHRELIDMLINMSDSQIIDD